MPSGILKRGLNEFEEQEVIVRLASNKAANDKQYTPIRLVMKESRACFISSCDVFKLITTQNQRGKDVKQIEIILCSQPGFSQRATFVEDPDTYETFVHIPKTKHNMRLLATNFNELWDIDNPGVLAEVVELTKTIEKVRDTSEIHKPASIQNVARAPEVDRLREEVATLRAREGQSPRAKTLTVEADMAVRRAEKEKNAALRRAELAEQLLGELQTKESSTLKDAAKEALLADTEFVDGLKAKSDRWWLSKEYRDRLAEEMKKLEEATVAVN